MSAPSKAISQTFAYAGTAGESHLSSNVYYSYCVVDNGTAVTLAVATDGGTAAAGAGTHMLSAPPNSVTVFPNLQPLPDPEPETVDEAGIAEPRRGRLWVPGRAGAGAAIAAFRAAQGRENNRSYSSRTTA